MNPPIEEAFSLTCANAMSSVLDGSGLSSRSSKELKDVSGDDIRELSSTSLQRRQCGFSDAIAHMAYPVAAVLLTLLQKSNKMIRSGTRYRRPFIRTSSTLTLGCDMAVDGS